MRAQPRHVRLQRGLAAHLSDYQSGGALENSEIEVKPTSGERREDLKTERLQPNR